MKTINLFSVLTFLFLVGATQAQLSVNIQIGTPPQWGPVGFNEVRYYYLPAVDGYKVVMPDYRGETPYIHFADHKTKYNGSYRSIPQRTIGVKPGNGNPKSNKHQDHQGGKGKNGR